MERVDFILGHSKIFLAVYGVLWLIAIFSCWFLACPFWVKSLLTIALIFYAVHLFNHHLLRKGQHAIVNVWQNAKGQWGFATKSGRKSIGVLSGTSYISRFFVILHIKTKFGERFIWIPKDAMTAFAYQLLCARIRFFTP